MYLSLLNLVPFAFDLKKKKKRRRLRVNIIETEVFFFSLKQRFKPAIGTRALDLCGKLERN